MYAYRRDGRRRPRPIGRGGFAISPDRLRIALLAGCLGQGGAEKQLFYMAAALQRVGLDVRVYSLTRGECYEATLKSSGITPIWIGRFGNPLIRLASLTQALWRFRPHIVQSGHFFTNLYVAISAQLCGAISIGGIRNDIEFEQAENGPWWPWLFRLPSALIANSATAARSAMDLGRLARLVRVLPNAIDVAAFDRQVAPANSEPAANGSQVITVGRLVREKRQDRFLRALADVRKRHPEVRGVLVGDGPMRPELESLAGHLGLLPDGVRFVGRSDDVAPLLRRSKLFVMTSDHEGFPNVVLEAMAAGLPVVTTPAGDSAEVVQDDRTGYVVGFEDFNGLVDRIVRLAGSPELRRRFGETGRRRVEEHYGFERLSHRLLGIYREIAVEQSRRHLLRKIDLQPGCLEARRVSSTTVRSQLANTKVLVTTNPPCSASRSNNPSREAADSSPAPEWSEKRIS